MVKLTKSVYFCEKKNWHELAFLRLSFGRKNSIVLTTEADLKGTLQIDLGDQQHDIKTHLTPEEEAGIPFRLSKYLILKIFNESNSVILAVCHSEDWLVMQVLLEKLIYNCRFTRACIIKQVQDNIIDIVLDAMINIGRRSFRWKDPKMQFSSKTQQFLDGAILDSHKQLPPEQYLNIAYKSCLYYGLFPIEILLRYSNYNYINQKIFKFLYDHSTPWSSCLASSIRIGREVYCDHRYSQNPNKYLLKLRILDFFPRDCWIQELAAFLKHNSHLIINKLKDAAYKQDKGMMKSSSQLKDPLLSQSSSQLESIRQLLIPLLKDCKVSELCTSIAQSFVNSYSLQLQETNILKKIATIMADTYEPTIFHNNINEMATKIVYLIHDTIKKIVQPIVLNQKARVSFEAELKMLESTKSIKEMWDHYQKSNNDKFRLYTRFGCQRDLLSYTSPIIIDRLVDFFGYFSDETSKVFHQKIKSIRHNQFGSVWDFLKERCKPQLEIFTNRLQYADMMVQSQNSKTTISIDKKDLRSLNSMILYESNEANERHKEICKCLLFWYYNSIRLKNSYKYVKMISCIGFVIVKDTV